MNNFTVVGNLSRDPELRFTPSGEAVVNFNIAQTPRKYDNNSKQWVDSGETNFYRCTAWGQKAQNIAESLNQGDRVLAMGRLKTEKYERNGETVSSTNNLDIDEIGPSLSYAEAKPVKNQKRANTGGGNFQNNGGTQANNGGGFQPNNGNQQAQANNGGFQPNNAGFNAPQSTSFDEPPF